MKEAHKKETPFERVLFFSDAIVAIAITLLALDLKLEVPEHHHLTFADLLLPWKKYLAFFLSFFNIAGFWRIHHNIYSYIKKMDDKSMYFNIGWVFFIITLPFATSVLSTHFGDAPAIFLYSMNIFLISIFQNSIWDYADAKEDFVDREKLPPEERTQFRIMFNLDMLNGLLALIFSFILPKLAFFLLFFKIPVFIFSLFYIGRIRRREKLEGKI
ncbi:TMEM175 family protein [Ferruginibacter albus]|uniref:TMEM175 family protein n=1 Tax=Ferruginibacter albus TaxID=2875540 RepID=UPI001CC5C141|nr:TMEM175 family protein [Ferruginibacter albus]UAY53572.1 DUF1211 domain-containing protein [Ferruginibacter albus]